MALNKKYSFKDFMDKDLTALPASDFNNSEIVGSCFYQQAAPDTQVFPTGITGVTFSKDNLDNVFIPPGNTIEPDCCHRKIMVQNDLEDWEVDNSLNPLKPINKKVFEGLGLSTDPKDIPAIKLKGNSVTQAKVETDKQADIDALKAFDPALAERLGVK